MGLDLEIAKKELIEKDLNLEERMISCPFEKLTADCDDEKECYEKIKRFLESLVS